MRSIVITMTAAILAMSTSSQAESRHLFILSGQSNMYHMPKEEFKAVVDKEFGEGNVTVACLAERGASIRKWDKDYEWPEGLDIPQGRKRPGKEPKTREAFIAEFGSNYNKLMNSVKRQTAGKEYDTVTFVWMQGESDSGRSTDIYVESFDRIVARLKSDLEVESINIVIGRLSDYGGDKWIKFRDRQVKYAEEHPNCEWINTDDLNDKVKDDGTVQNDLHYTEEGYKILAERFAEKAIALIEKQ